MQALATYSPSEISLHTTKKSCSLSIHGKGYDPSGEPSGPTLGPKLISKEQTQPSYGFFDYFLPLVVPAITFAGWYYLTIYSKAKA